MRDIKFGLYSKDKYKSHADILNKCFGFKYRTFLPAYKDINILKAVWFPNLLSSEISVRDGGKMIMVHNAKGKISFWKLIKRRYVFAKVKTDDDYSYIGVYRATNREGDKIVFSRLFL